MKYSCLRLFGLAALASTLVFSVPSCSSTKKKIKAIFNVKDSLVKIAKGDSDEVYPMVSAALTASQDWVIVTNEKKVLVAEIHRIPGTGVKLPTTGDSRYYLRIDLEDLGGSTKLVFKFFKSLPGEYLAKAVVDDLITKYVSGLFEDVLGQLLSYGCVFR